MSIFNTDVRNQLHTVASYHAFDDGDADFGIKTQRIETELTFVCEC